MCSLDSKPAVETTAADTPSSPKTNPTDTTSSSKTTSAALQALFYDHGTKPNTGNVIPISEWEKILIGKEWIREDAEGNENTFKRSHLPKPNRVNGFINDGMRQRDRLNVDCDRRTNIVRWVKYG